MALLVFLLAQPHSFENLTPAPPRLFCSPCWYWVNASLGVPPVTLNRHEQALRGKGQAVTGSSGAKATIPTAQQAPAEAGAATHLVMLPMQQEMQCDEIVVTSGWLHVEDKAMDEIL